jgi:putative transposase
VVNDGASEGAALVEGLLLIEGRLASPDGRAELVKLATRLIVEEALEAECRDALGRDYYERGAEAGRGY